jgi:hypothetical protein
MDTKRDPRMIQGKLYTIVKGDKDPEGQTIQVKPTEYLLGLKPHEAIDELQANVQFIAQQLEDCSGEDFEVPKNIDKVRGLIFELEIAQGYLAEVFKSWQARHGGHAEGPGD